MRTNLSFDYEASALFDAIDAETSRHAAILRYEDGASAYDVLKIHTNDRPIIDGFIVEAFITIMSKFKGEALYDLENGTHTVQFFLPDFDSVSYSSAQQAMQDYIVHSATSRWLLNRSFTEPAKTFAADADSSLNRAISILRTRVSPLNS